MTTLEDLLSLEEGGPTLEKKSQYVKVGSGQNSSKGAIQVVTEEMGEGSLRERFGFVPKSILRFDRNAEMLKALGDTSSVRGQLRSAIGGGYASKLRYSMYNVDAAKFFLDYYMPPRASILDPFMGRGSRSLAAYLLGMSYTGFDTCSETIGVNRQLLARHSGKEELPEGWAFHHSDGTELEPYRGHGQIFDGVFSCPPYYSTEKYSGEEGDLSHLKVLDFDNRIRALFRNLYPLVKSSGRLRPELYPVIFTVGTYRQGEGGLKDMDYLFQSAAFEAGFILHDKVITENIPPGAGYTFRRNFGSGYVCKAHETTLVFLRRA
jgi:hypothetical protein